MSLFTQKNNFWTIALSDISYIVFKINNNKKAMKIQENIQTKIRELIVTYYVNSVQKYCLFGLISDLSKKENDPVVEKVE